MKEWAMAHVGGWAGKILRVDLSTGKIWTEPSLEYGRKYIGGRGLAARIAWNEIPPGTGPFDPENRLILSVGPLTGTSAPNSGRATVCSLSPQAFPYEWFSYSSVGGYWGPTLKYAGYDAIVVQGESSQPVYLWVDDARVELRDARELWGKGTFATQEHLMREHGSDIRALTIGQAGENRCRIAIIASGSASAAGQGGFGAVMGSKNLKAIAARVGLQRRLVRMWLRRYGEQGWVGLADKRGRGRRPVFSPGGGAAGGEAGLRATG
jgi:aldehyde:ferredoxin oxidoreductase